MSKGTIPGLNPCGFGTGPRVDASSRHGEAPANRQTERGPHTTNTLGAGTPPGLCLTIEGARNGPQASAVRTSRHEAPRLPAPPFKGNGELVERYASIAFGLLVAALLLAWLLEEWLRRAERTLDSFVPVADRLGDVGAAFHRLMAALRRAWERWQGKP
jgi:hypothetical protein